MIWVFLDGSKQKLDEFQVLKKNKSSNVKRQDFWCYIASKKTTSNYDRDFYMSKHFDGTC